MQPANTGTAIKSNKDVISKDQINNGKFSKEYVCILKIVIKKFKDPAIDDKPAKCRLKIAKSIAGVVWPMTSLKGGYIVQPVPTPPSIKDEIIRKLKDNGTNQKLKLFNLGYAISIAPNNKGINKFPKPPIRIGITIKKNHYKSMICY